MAKLSLYIPDAMKADIEKWRGKLNFSQLFWAAFERATRKGEREARQGQSTGCGRWRPPKAEFRVLT